jgi:dipeptidyl aminopeptidase/acylaminoacyl peptidase
MSGKLACGFANLVRGLAGVFLGVWTAGAAAMVSGGKAGGAESRVPANLVLDGVAEPGADLWREVGPYLEFRPSTFQDWHPSRRDVLMTTRRGEVPQLHRVRVPRGPQVPITALGDRVWSGSYAPGDGDCLVFSADRGGDEFLQMYRIAGSGGEPVLLTDGRSRNTSPVWDASGTRIAYLSTRRNGRDTDLHLMDPRREGGDRRLAELSGGGWRVLDVSPNDRWLLLAEVVSVNESSLHRVKVGTGERRRITPDGPGRVAFPDGVFLDDGRTVLAVTDAGSEHRRLVRLDAGTGAMEPFGPGWEWGVEGMAITADRRTVAVVVNEAGFSGIRILDVATGRELARPRLPAGVVSGLRWRPGRPEVGFTLSSAHTPGDVHSVDVRTGALTRWTDGGVGGVRTRRFAEPELMTVRSFDGLAMSGLLYRPDARRYPGRRPVVVIIHGGPEGQSRPQFLRAWNHLIEERGVALLLPNVRGSEGYGKTFLGLDDGLKREDAVKDIGAFLDAVAGDEGLDAGRVAVYGGSYGGYMVLASLARYEDRLRCGIDVVGISNFLTFLRNTQDYRRDLRRAEYGDERDPGMAAFLERISPLNQVDRIRVPVLVAQGLNDPRVPVTESEQLVRAIRARGGVVGYLLARDEGHGFVRKANADFLFVAMVSFLEDHLLGR